MNKIILLVIIGIFLLFCSDVCLGQKQYPTTAEPDYKFEKQTAIELPAQMYDCMNPCWKMIYPDEPWNLYENPDSVMIDTCLSYRNPEDPTRWEHKVLYAKRFWRVQFPLGALDIPAKSSLDTIERTWRDIDSNFVDLKNSFEEFELKFGKFILRKISPETGPNLYRGRLFKFSFKDYRCIDSVLLFLKSIKDLEDYMYLVQYCKWAGNLKEPGFEMGNLSDFGIKSKTILYQNKPNPFYTQTNIQYYISNKTDVKLEVYDLFGLKIVEIVNKTENAGWHNVNFDGSGLLSGINFLKLHTSNSSETVKIIKLD